MVLDHLSNRWSCHRHTHTPLSDACSCEIRSGHAFRTFLDARHARHHHDWRCSAVLHIYFLTLEWWAGITKPWDAANVVDALVGSHKPHSRSCSWLQEERAIILPRLLPPSNEPEQPGTLPSFFPSHVPTSSPALSKPSTAYRLLKAACGPSALSLHSPRHERNG